jgi:Tol biopolymer transport system component
VAVDRNGSHRRVLVRNINAPGYSVEPVWSPNGRQLALALRFGRTGSSRTDPARQRLGIYVVSSNGMRFRRVAATAMMASPGLTPAWSRDSRHIAFADTKGISVAEVTRRTQRRVTSMGAESTVSWAPAAKILFTHRDELYAVRAGRRPRRIPH